MKSFSVTMYAWIETVVEADSLDEAFEAVAAADLVITDPDGFSDTFITSRSVTDVEEVQE